jgi:hypothetical protein
VCKGRRYILRRAGISTRRRQITGGSDRRRACSLDHEITMLATALNELAAIRSTAEQAAGKILNSAETLLADAETRPHAESEQAAISIMTACDFHDLVGQRAQAITETIDKIIALRLQREERERKQCAAKAKRKSQPTLHGPALPGRGPDQDAIDALFAKA